MKKKLLVLLLLLLIPSVVNAEEKTIFAYSDLAYESIKSVAGNSDGSYVAVVSRDDYKNYEYTRYLVKYDKDNNLL